MKTYQFVETNKSIVEKANINFYYVIVSHISLEDEYRLYLEPKHRKIRPGLELRFILEKELQFTELATIYDPKIVDWTLVTLV